VGEPVREEEAEVVGAAEEVDEEVAMVKEMLRLLAEEEAEEETEEEDVAEGEAGMHQVAEECSRAVLPPPCTPQGPMQSMALLSTCQSTRCIRSKRCSGADPPPTRTSPPPAPSQRHGPPPVP
jgi:hypothetical protein